jgi:hypothetical protein
MIGGEWSGYGVLQTLVPREKSADLCNEAGRDLTKAEWATYVGSVASWRPLCEESQKVFAAMYVAVRRSVGIYPPVLVRTTTASEVQQWSSFCSETQPVAGSQGGDGFWWTASSGDSAAMVPICVDGLLRWMAPRVPALQIEEGRVEGTPVMIVSGVVPEGGISAHRIGLGVLSADGTATGLSFLQATPSVTPSDVRVTGVLGRLEVEWDVTANSDGAWRVAVMKPIGPAA